MLDPLLRPLKDRLLDPLARATGGRLHPNVVSVLSFAAGIAVVLLLLRGAHRWGLVAWILSRVLDGLDGAVARAHGRQTDFGGYLDILLDFVVYAAIPIALILGRPPAASTHLAVMCLLATFYVNAASWMYLAAILEKRAQGAAARGEQTTVTMPTALVGGTETLIFFSLFILLPRSLVPLFLLMAALVGLNVVQRLIWAARHL